MQGETKYIFVTGGVASSLGKGIISSSIGKLLQARGYNITIQKFGPYINIDPGTLNPYEHGECYVTVDGHEADLDLGHYERFTGIRSLLSYGGRLLTYMQTVRFLTDYLNGDTYYKTHKPKHNLIRTRAQFKLLQSLEAHAEEMNAFMKEWL